MAEIDHKGLVRLYEAAVLKERIHELFKGLADISALMTAAVFKMEYKSPV